MKRSSSLLLLLASLALPACDGDPGTAPETLSVRAGAAVATVSGVSAEIEAFVAAGLFPDQRSLQALYTSGDGSIVGFRVEYGPLWCRPFTGCTYSEAYGIQVGDRIGWLTMTAEGTWEEIPHGEIPWYDITADDEVLFSTQFIQSLGQAADAGGRAHLEMYNALSYALALNPQTPERTLVRLAREMNQRISTRTGYALLWNPSSTDEVFKVLTRLNPPAEETGEYYGYVEISRLAAERLAASVG